MNTYFSTEQVSKYHPDKVADQISDAIVEECLKQDPKSHVACETLVKDDRVVLAGEISTSAVIDYASIAKSVMEELNYPVHDVLNFLTQQSSEINSAVGDAEGAGDQGLMFGYAVDEENYLPVAFNLANNIIAAVEDDISDNPDSIFKGDAKTQITSTGDTSDDIEEILLSVCTKEGVAIEDVKEYVTKLLDAKGLNIARNLVLNPSGLWTFGGPAADCGLTGRKIVCDQYGGYAPVGGGAFSGKDPSKVDRSGAYMARRIAVDCINEGFDECTVELSYGIGLAEPRGVSVLAKKNRNSHKVYDLSKEVKDKYDLTPQGIIKYLDLLTLPYKQIASGNHMLWFC